MTDPVQRSFTTPEGKRVTAWVPAGATEADIIREFKAHTVRKALSAPKLRTAMQTAADFGDNVIDNLLPNWGDEAAGIQEATGGRQPIPLGMRAFNLGRSWAAGEDVLGRFRKGQTNFRRSQAQYAKEHPRLATASTVGGMGASLLLPGGAAVKGAGILSKMAQTGKVGALYGAMAGAGKGDTLDERASNGISTGIVTAGLGALSPLAIGGAGWLAQQARLRVPGVDAAARVIGDGLQTLGNKARGVRGRPSLPVPPPRFRARPQANRMVADAIDQGPIRHGPASPHAPAATPAAVADEVERRAAMNVPAMVGDVTDPLSHTTGWASRGTGPGQRMVRESIAARKAQEANRLRQHVVDTMGPVVDPIAQMETHMATAKASAGPGYRAAYAEPMVLTPEIEQIMGTPAFREAVPQAVRNIQNGMSDPTGLGFRMDRHGNVDGINTLTTEGFDHVIRAMRDSGRAAADINPITGKVINNTNSVHINARAGELRDHLSAQNPAYADVTGRYADDMAVRDAFHQGQDVGSLTGHEVNAQARALPDSAHGSWSIGARSAMADEASKYAAAHPTGDTAGHLRTMLGDDIKQDALGRMTGNTGAVRGLHDRLDAEQQAHGVWQEVQRNAGATRRATTDRMDGHMGNSGPGAMSWRGKAGEFLGDIMSKAEPQYAKDVRDHVSTVLTERNPATVRTMMDDVAAQSQRDADLAKLVQNMQLRGLQGSYAALDPYRADTD